MVDLLLGCCLTTLQVLEQGPPLPPARCQHSAPEMGNLKLKVFSIRQAAPPAVLQPADLQVSLQNLHHVHGQGQKLGGCTVGHSPQGDLKELIFMKLFLASKLRSACQ